MILNALFIDFQKLLKLRKRHRQDNFLWVRRYKLSINLSCSAELVNQITTAFPKLLYALSRYELGM